MSRLVETSSNLIPPGEDVSQYSQREIDDRIFGSKLVLVVEQMQILTIWLIKTCLLIMYNRMTLVLPQHRVVIVTSVYVAVTFVGFIHDSLNMGTDTVCRLLWRFCTLLFGVDLSIR